MGLWSRATSTELLEPERGDKELALAFQRGEKDAYKAIHDRYSARVQRLCRRMLVNPDDAQEATQETFLRTYQALVRFNGRYQLGPWITRIATNVCLDHLRAGSRRSAEVMPLGEGKWLDGRGGPNGDFDPEAIYLRRMEGRRVLEVLATLPPVHKAAIILRDFEGLSYADMAIALEMTENRVKALLHRARGGFKRSWIDKLMTVLVPVRLLPRLRRAEMSVRDGVPSYVSSSASNAAELMSSSGSALGSCSVFVHQCGQMVGERAAAVITAVVVGTAALGAAEVASPPDASSAPSSVAVRLDEGAGADPNDRPVGPTGEPAAEESAEGSTVEPEGPVPPEEGDPVEAEPTPPATEPAEEPAQPEPTPTPSAEEPAQYTEEPPEPEPSGFDFDFSIDLAGSTSPCECLGATAVESERVQATQTGDASWDQVVSGTARAAGTDQYGLRIEQRVETSRTSGSQEIDFRLGSAEGEYEYKASGTLVSADHTAWGGWAYRFEGSYTLIGPRPDESVPETGTYTAEIVVSYQHGRITSDRIYLSEG